MSMEKLQAEVERLKDHFDAIDGEREVAYHKARDLRRMSVQAVRDAHRGRFDDAKKLVSEGMVLAGELAEHSVRFGFVEEAQQEYAEAAFTIAFLLGEEPPTQDEIKTDERGYMLGLSDAVGELRRHILDLMVKDRLDEAEKFMEMMDDIQGMLMKFDHTDAVIPLRRKQDQVRGIIERTRADLTNMICQKRLERRLAEQDKK